MIVLGTTFGMLIVGSCLALCAAGPIRDSVLTEIDGIFRRNAEASHYPGHAYGVIVDGDRVLTGVLGVADIETGRPVTTSTRFHIASLTKSVTAMAILKLRDEGKLALSDPVSKYVPEFGDVALPTADAPDVTIENLLTMTSGFPEDNPWADRHLEDSPEDMMRRLREGVSFSRVPGIDFEYSNLGYALLGVVIREVSGRSYNDYIDAEILAPLGMHETHWEFTDVPADELALGYLWSDDTWQLEPMLHNGAFGAIGGIITSLDDFTRYVSFHLDAWPPRDAPDTGPVRRSTVREMHRSATSRLDAVATDVAGDPCAVVSGYGYGLGVRTDCHGVTRVSHSGGLPGFGSNVYMYPDAGVAVISFANHRYGDAGSAQREVEAVLRNAGLLEPRAPATSPILAERTAQVAALVQTWDDALAAAILADNFDLDQPRAARRRDAERLLAEIGPVLEVTPVVPTNRLRGTFEIRGERGAMRVFFSMSPEAVPRVQALGLTRIEGP